MATLTAQIKQCIEEKLAEGKHNFIIFPFGDVGMQVKRILNEGYGIQELCIIDNNLYRFNPQIKRLSFLEHIDCASHCLILACTNQDIYEILKTSVRKYFPKENIAELPSMTSPFEIWWKTKIGKHSYGPICRNHLLIESIGAFCSFAPGTEVVFNHESQYLTTSPIIYRGATEGKFIPFTEFKNLPYYIEGIQPKQERLKQVKRIKIGNDVWLGQNVLITNYADIGNGVIAGAGAVITKDIPDYAVVTGVPAQIIRYRYSPEEIKNLNRIAWWDWSDEKIKENYDDFYLPVGEFIKKHLK